MPVHQFVHDSGLIERGLSNYWGYNTIGFFAPHNGYASFGGHGGQVQEFKTMVKALHRAGIEVILDVVYNHTAEGNHLGPTLSFRGIDNAAYYRLVDADRQYYYDTTGTGNSLNVRHHESLRLIMDSLRYWVTDMHVDGFRFDLASALAREFHEVNRLAAFFDLVNQDPIVSQVKLIAEPWDVGDGGYQVGGFPPLWTEWNGKYRDTVRDFWRGDPASLGEFASRFTGSSDLYEIDGRRPIASINFVTAHDGFTLTDLVSYDDKHNDANGEDNHDGESHNRSWNSGVEGPTDDPGITALRERRKRNFLATLLLSQGVPMISHGDELGRTQGGNNNVYGQDSELSWIDWDDARANDVLTRFTANLTRLRAEHPALPAPPVLRRPAGGRLRPHRHRLAAPRRHADGRKRLERRIDDDDHRLPQRPRHPGTRPARRTDRRRLVPAAVQPTSRERDVHVARQGVRPDVGGGRRHRRPAVRHPFQAKGHQGQRPTRQHRPVTARPTVSLLTAGSRPEAPAFYPYLSGRDNPLGQCRTALGLSRDVCGYGIGVVCATAIFQPSGSRTTVNVRLPLVGRAGPSPRSSETCLAQLTSAMSGPMKRMSSISRRVKTFAIGLFSPAVIASRSASRPRTRCPAMFTNTRSG